jgi:hypothetical protein
MGAAAVATDAKREHVGMFDEQQQVADTIRAAVFHKRTLERQCLGVRHQAQPSNLDGATDLTRLANLLNVHV